MDTDTALDPAPALARLALLTLLPGSRVAASVALLPAALNIAFVPGPVPRGQDYRSAGQSLPVHPGTRVRISQDWIRVPTVARYIARLAAGNSLDPVELSEDPDGTLSHVNGAHRMLASRLLGLPFYADLRVLG